MKTINKIAVNWRKLQWGFYDLQFPFKERKVVIPIQEVIKLNPKLLIKP